MQSCVKFAYHIELLLPFVPEEASNGMEWSNRYSSYSMSDRQIHGRAHGLKGQRSVQSDLAKRGGQNNNTNKDTLSNSLPNYTGWYYCLAEIKYVKHKLWRKRKWVWMEQWPKQKKNVVV